MARTPSNMLELGTQAPNFSLPDPDGNVYALSDFKDKKALVVMFICNHCPFVKHIEAELARFGNDYKDKDVGLVAINSNDVNNYPDDRPEKMKEKAEQVGYCFPYLFDESQEVAKAFKAACTPDFYLFDEDQKLVYRGQFDDSRPGNGRPVNGKDLRSALDLVLEGRKKEILPEQRPSLGCNIKWR